MSLLREIYPFFFFSKLYNQLFRIFKDLQKYALLMEIADSVIERLCLSLIIPVVRPNSVKVFSHILCSAQSRKLFMKIVPRIPKVFQSIQGNMHSSNDPSIPPDVQLFIDMVSAFVRRYGEYDLEFSEIVSVFVLKLIFISSRLISRMKL